MGSECSICGSEFFTSDGEGMQGLVGILPVNLCTLCYNGMVEMVEQLEANAHIECPECGHGIKLKVSVTE